MKEEDITLNFKNQVGVGTTEGEREEIQTKEQARMEKKVSSNATVILIVRHLQTHYATNHLY